jgi:glucosamine-6-phosphate deaminase
VARSAREGVTLGLNTLLAARRVLILAFGAHTEAAVKRMVNRPVAADCPAAFLQDHIAAHVFLDEAAARVTNHAEVALGV